MDDQKPNQPECRHEWLSLSEEAGIGPTLNYRVGISICLTCATIKVAGFRGDNHFDEHFKIDLPKAIAAIVANIPDKTEFIQELNNRVPKL